MPATLKTRKPVVKLTVGDFRAYSIWEFATDEESDGEHDETWVRPVEGVAIRKGKYSQLVASDFRTPASKKLQGFMVVTTAGKQVEVVPGAVVGRVGYCVLPRLSRKQAASRKYEWVLRDRDRLCKAVGARECDVFPLRYSLRVSVVGEKKLREGIMQ